MPLDILALAAHRDDVEQTCGGTLLKMAERGYRTGILDLTQGEMGTRGNAEDRAREAAEAARILKVSWRHALDIPDGRVENTWENRLKIARVIREQRPRVLILPYWEGRHPDHYAASVLGYEAAFLAGLAKLDVDQASANQDLLDKDLKGRGFSRAAETAKDLGLALDSALIVLSKLFMPACTAMCGQRLSWTSPSSSKRACVALMAYKSQFTDQQAGSGIFPAHKEIRARIESMARFYGMLGGVTYAEPFVQKEVGLVDDVMAIPVKSI